MLIQDAKVKRVAMHQQKMFEERGENKPMFTGCQHHILDKVLQHIMNEELNAGKTRSQISNKMFRSQFQDPM